MLIGIEAKYQVRTVRVRDLEENMILAEDVKTTMGLLLISRAKRSAAPYWSA
jgi:hypothetical protein